MEEFLGDVLRAYRKKVAQILLLKSFLASKKSVF